MADVALSRTNRVTVSGCACVQEFERRVVVWLSHWGTHSTDDEDETTEDI